MTQETLIPFFQLDSPRDHSHKHKVSRSLDTEAVFNVLVALLALGRRLGRSRYNHPPKGKLVAPPPILPLTHPVGRGDRVISGSRPNLFDHKEKHPKVMKLGYTELEEPIQEAWRPYFKNIIRDTLQLAPELASRLEAGFESRACVDVGTRQGSKYRNLPGGKKKETVRPRTPAFLLNLDDFYQGAGLTSFFAMDGVTALVFSLILRERHPEWLETPGFRMVELVGTKIPPRMDDLSFSDGWEAVSILHVAP